jgi:hypothetical protein
VFTSAVEVVTADLLARGEPLAAVDRLRASVGGGGGKRPKHDRRARQEEA